MRLKSELWVKAYLRRCMGEGAQAVVGRRGAEEAGAIFLKVDRLDGRVRLFAPAPAGLDTASTERRWTERALDGEDRVRAALEREARIDPDFWLIEVEDKEGRHFLGDDLLPPEPPIGR